MAGCVVMMSEVVGPKGPKPERPHICSSACADDPECPFIAAYDRRTSLSNEEEIALIVAASNSEAARTAIQKLLQMVGDDLCIYRAKYLRDLYCER